MRPHPSSEAFAGIAIRFRTARDAPRASPRPGPRARHLTREHVPLADVLAGYPTISRTAAGCVSGASLSVVAIPAGPRRRGARRPVKGGGHRGSPSSSTKIHKECTHDAQSPVCRVHADPGSPGRPGPCSRRGLPASAPGRAAGPGRRRGRRRDRRAALRAHAGAHQPPQRHEAQDGGHHRRRGGTGHPRAADRIVLPLPAPPPPAGGQGPDAP